MEAIINNIKGNIMGTTSFHLQIKGMRKSQDFIVYPIGKDDTSKDIKIQSDTRIGTLNIETGKGEMSQSHQGGAYFMHLSIDKKTPFELKTDDLESLRTHLICTADDKAGKNGVVFCDNSSAIRL